MFYCIICEQRTETYNPACNLPFMLHKPPRNKICCSVYKSISTLLTAAHKTLCYGCMLIIESDSYEHIKIVVKLVTRRLPVKFPRPAR